MQMLIPHIKCFHISILVAVFNCAYVDLSLTECLYHGALDTVKNLCYGKQRCLLSVNDQQFRNPCMPETKKYLSVVYSCGMGITYSLKSNKRKPTYCTLI